MEYQQRKFRKSSGAHEVDRQLVQQLAGRLHLDGLDLAGRLPLCSLSNLQNH